MDTRRRRRPLGAEVFEDGVHFRVHAPRRSRVRLSIESEPAQIVTMEGSADAGFECFVPDLRAGALYRFLLDDDEKPYPDPVSRFQPEGPHGPSEVVDPGAFAWRDGAFPGVELRGQVVYELHVGTFTREGTYRSAARELHALAELGIGLIELMPLAEFPGRFGWGYDGVNLFAPTRLYGGPNDLRSFIDEAHAHGIGVLLDVVYNHLGPDGNYLSQFSETFFSDKKTDWGAAVNYDGEGSQPVRAYFCDNAAYWIDEYHFDGIRLDATQDIWDTGTPHIIDDLVASARAAAGSRKIVVIAENEPQESSLVRAVDAVDQASRRCDALWNDDFHHSAMAAATGHAEAYYSETRGAPQELISALKWGYLYQGQYYAWQKKPRGEPAFDLPAESFVLYLQNHDQVANSARGLRLHRLTSPGRARALKALLLLAPGTPMLFQGEEFDASSPFHYFADHQTELADMVRRGRVDFVRQFPSLRGPGVRSILPDPSSTETFVRSKLDHREREKNVEALTLTRDLIALRKNDPVFKAQRSDRMHGAVLGAEAFVLRFFGERGDDRLLLVNLGLDLALYPAPEPLLAPPRKGSWQIVFSTEDPEYGGSGTPPLDAYESPRLHGHSAVVLAPGKPLPVPNAPRAR
ncbi:MAG: 1,4-alpha-glucan-branching protein [Myxococcaceae bacterium]|nr:1,4-alpha-glucan-branching protein [Myxococcaceae bacterium]